MKTYEEVAEQHELDQGTRERFITYMRIRWGDPKDETIKCQVGYASEWAGWFKVGIEYSASDCKGQAILDRMSGIKEGPA